MTGATITSDEDQNQWVLHVVLFSIIHRMTGVYENGVVTPFSSFDLEGVAATEDPAVRGASVFISIMSGNDALIERQQRETRSIGSVDVSKHAAHIKTIPAQASKRIAGVEIMLLLTKDQFGELRDGLALNPQLPKTFQFRCAGGTLKRDREFGPNKLALTDADQKLRVLFYNLDLSVCKLDLDRKREVQSYISSDAELP